jgi:heme/copper-type cytochrome/quinol oxidase subunit 3
MTTIEPIWTREETRPLGWWGMLLAVATEGTLFATLLASYLYLRFKNVAWPPDGIHKPHVLLPCVATALLLAAVGAVAVAARALKQRRQGSMLAATACALACTLAYTALQFVLLRADWGDFRPSDNAYASIYYTVAGVLWAHVAAGALLLAFALFQLARQSYRPVRGSALQVTALYVYFLGVTGLAVLITLYLSPQL